MSYDLDSQMPTLGFTKVVALNEHTIVEACREVEEVYQLLTEARGGIPLPKRKYDRKTGDICNKVLEYARTHAEFTIKGLSADTGINIKSLYNVIAELVENKIIKREQVGAGLSNLYRLSVARVEVSTSKPNTYAVPNPERERMQSAH